MADFGEELEPLFDYSRVQPISLECIDDDDAETPPPSLEKRRKIAKPKVANEVEKNAVVIDLDFENKEEEDWLPPPPKVSSDDPNALQEDSTIKALRLKKQELVSFAESVKNVLQTVEELAKKDLDNAEEPSSVAADDNQMAKVSHERAKIVISVQDKDGLQKFLVFMDDKFERMFKTYADKNKLDPKSLVFCFDGDKVSPSATPDSLGMEDNDILEVHVKSGR